MRGNPVDLSASFAVREVQDLIPEVHRPTYRRIEDSRLLVPQWQVGSQFLARHHSFSLLNSEEAISRQIR
jgi:hypothetical protein